MNRRTKAFTLLEVLIVITILSMLIAVVFPAVDAYFGISSKYRAKTHGGELYSAASAAVDASYSFHKTEYCEGLRKSKNYTDLSGKSDTLYYDFLMNDSLSAVQFTSGSGRTFNYAEGFKQLYTKNGGKQKGLAYMSRYTLENLNALTSNISAAEERLVFSSNQTPVNQTGGRGSTVNAYFESVNKNTYNAGSGARNCKQAGIIVCYGKTEDGGGELIYTEYGDDDGYLVICVNPKWYFPVKDKLGEVSSYDSKLTESQRNAIPSRGENDPVIIVSENGTYEAMP